MNIYFDTSSWNHLAIERTDREKLVCLILKRNYRVLASVISVGEVLRDTDGCRREKIRSTMGTLHGDGPLLERPLDLSRAAAEAVFQGQEDFPLPRTGPGEYLLACLQSATHPPPGDEIWGWLSNMRDCWCQFRARLNQLSLQPSFDVLPDVAGSDALLKLLCKLPTADALGVSLSQMRSIYKKSDVWKALGATLAYMIKPSTTHAPKNKKGRRAPDAPDLWQATYLGLVEVFVTDDGPMRDTISEISSAARFRHPRRTEGSDSLIAYYRQGNRQRGFCYHLFAGESWDVQRLLS